MKTLPPNPQQPQPPQPPSVGLGLLMTAPPGRGDPHFGHTTLLAKTLFLLFIHAPLGQSQSPGVLALLAAPQAGQEVFLPKTILVEFMQPLFGQGQSSETSLACNLWLMLGRPNELVGLPKTPPPEMAPRPTPPPLEGVPPKVPL